MKQDIIKQFINNRFDDLLYFAEKVGNEFDIDTIHYFKEEYKLVRSLINFIKIQKIDKSIKVPEKCKELYQAAGTIREVQIELQLSEGAGDINSEEHNNLLEMLERAKQEWNRNYSANLFTKLQKELVDVDYKKIRVEFLENFFNGSFVTTQSKKQLQ